MLLTVLSLNLSFRQFSGWRPCRSGTASRPAFHFFLYSYIFPRERFLIILRDFKNLLRIINLIVYKDYGQKSQGQYFFKSSSLYPISGLGIGCPSMHIGSSKMDQKVYILELRIFVNIILSPYKSTRALGTLLVPLLLFSLNKLFLQFSQIHISSVKLIQANAHHISAICRK